MEPLAIQCQPVCTDLRQLGQHRSMFLPGTGYLFMRCDTCESIWRAEYDERDVILGGDTRPRKVVRMVVGLDGNLEERG